MRIFLFVINADWYGLICIDWIELFVRIFLISSLLKIHVCWKEVMHQTVNNILTLQKIYILHLDKNSYHRLHYRAKPVPENAALHIVCYSCHLFTVGTTLLFKQSVSSTNTTVHILQRVTALNQDTLQYFPPVSTSTSLSHTRLHLTNSPVWLKGCPVLMQWDIYLYLYLLIRMYIGYQQFIFWYLMEERLAFRFVS
jgi:hypothetical protein